VRGDVFIYLCVALSTIGVTRGLTLASAVENRSHALIVLVVLRGALPGLCLGSALLACLAPVVPAAAAVGLVLVLTRPVLSAPGRLIGLVAAEGSQRRRMLRCCSFAPRL
jgi:predicted Na+-dependent transporter